MVGVSPETVKAWELGKRQCTGPAARLLAVLDVLWKEADNEHTETNDE
jgi:DNA-binding transcriptional regulator YiaG